MKPNSVQLVIVVLFTVVSTGRASSKLHLGNSYLYNSSYWTLLSEWTAHIYSMASNTVIRFTRRGDGGYCGTTVRSGCSRGIRRSNSELSQSSYWDQGLYYRFNQSFTLLELVSAAFTSTPYRTVFHLCRRLGTALLIVIFPTLAWIIHTSTRCTPSSFASTVSRVPSHIIKFNYRLAIIKSKSNLVLTVTFYRWESASSRWLKPWNPA